MTEAQARFVELEKKKEEVKQFFIDLDAALKAVAEEAKAVEFYFQDDDGIVYKVGPAKGQWIDYKTIGYTRTRRAGEDKGSLSIKEAEGHGFKMAR